jgi:hypothetical protein
MKAAVLVGLDHLAVIQKPAGELLVADVDPGSGGRRNHAGARLAADVGLRIKKARRP